MSPLQLSDFERDALEPLMRYATIPALSPAYDAEWAAHGYLSETAELLADWVRARTLADATVDVIALDGRTPMLVVDVAATAPVAGTTMLYGHMDKQPPLGEWSPGLAPFAPVRRGDQIFARGVADDGYSTFAALLAIEDLERRGVGHGRCVVLIEASEESGSPDLEFYLDHLRDTLGDVRFMICLDSGALTYDRLWVTTSLRGVASVDVTVSVMDHGLHSGSVSGVVPSSFRILRQLLDRLEDARTGEILLPELHAEIPASHREAATAVAEEFGDIAAADLPLRPGLALMGRDAADRLLGSTWRPTLSVTGMGGIPTPDIAGNVLRPFTTATLSFRLPPGVSAPLAYDAIARALTNEVPSGAEVTVEGEAADGWVATELPDWLAAALGRASMESFGRAPGFAGEGGTIPFLASLGRRYPGVAIVATGVLGPKSNAHAIDEMLDLPMCVQVTNAVASLLADYAEHHKENA